MSEIGEKKYSQLLKPLPVVELDKAVLGWRAWRWPSP